MTICSPSTGYIALRPRAMFSAWDEQIIMSPSLKGNNGILYLVDQNFLTSFAGSALITIIEPVREKTNNLSSDQV